jgi:hypothetical protein
MSSYGIVGSFHGMLIPMKFLNLNFIMNNEPNRFALYTYLHVQDGRDDRFSFLRVRATRGYATPAIRPPPPFALENNLTDTEKKTPKKKKKKFVLARAVPRNCPDGQTDTENKTKQNKKKKGPCWPGQCPETARTIHHQ